MTSRAQPSGAIPVGLLAVAVAVSVALSAPPVLGQEPTRSADPVPSASLVPSPSLVPSADDAAYPFPGVYSLGAETAVYTEAFDAPVDWVGLGRQGRRSARLEDGRLVQAIRKGDSPALYWSETPLPSSSDVVYAHVRVSFAPGNSGEAGVLCSADGGLPRSFVAGINADAWWLGRLIDTRLRVVTSGSLDELAGPPDPEVAPVKVAIECAAAPESGGDWVLVLIDDQPVGVGTFPLLDIPIGPYGTAGILVGTEGPATTDMSFDDFAIFQGDALVPRGGPLPPGFTDQPGD